MGITDAEWNAAKGERDGVEIDNKLDGDGWGAYVAVDGVEVYADGGETEDLIVCRDLWPLVMALRTMAAERTRLREVARLARRVVDDRGVGGIAEESIQAVRLLDDLDAALNRVGGR